MIFFFSALSQALVICSRFKLLYWCEVCGSVVYAVMLVVCRMLKEHDWLKIMWQVVSFACSYASEMSFEICLKPCSQSAVQLDGITFVLLLHLFAVIANL